MDFTDSLYIGAGANAGPHELNWNGYIDDVRITKGLAVYTGNFTAPTSALTKTWSASTNIASNSDASKVKLLIHGDGAKFTDSSSDSPANNTTHTITPTGSFHSQEHGGIAPAMAFPASLKKTGSAGAYFDGTTNTRLNVNVDGGLWANDWSWECWFYVEPGNNQHSDQKTLFGLSHGSGKANFGVQTANSDNIQHLFLYFDHDWSSPWHVNNSQGSATIYNNTWYHVLFKKTSGQLAWYLNGSSTADKVNGSLGSAANMNSSLTQMHIGSWEGGGQGYFKGYIDGIRFSSTARTPSLPTKIYGVCTQQTHP